jgi:hypothetical protein
MKLSKEQYELLNAYIGQGNFTSAHYVFFGNEFGLSESATILTYLTRIKSYILKNNIYVLNDKWENGFMLTEADCAPVKSIFIQFISRLILALESNNDKWFNKLSIEDKLILNYYIEKRLNREDECIINLRPLPRSTERVWPYDNISQKDYIKTYNFLLKNGLSESLRIHCDQKSTLVNHLGFTRTEILQKLFKNLDNKILIGIGDKRNKRKFIESIYPDIIFKEQNKMFISHKPKIILSDYFDNKNGIGLEGLHNVFKIIKKLN